MRSNISKLSDAAAQVIRDSFQAKDADTYKQVVSEKLDQMQKNGEISHEEYEAAQKFIKKEGGLFDALAARNRVEGTYYDYAMNGFEDLADEKANSLMKECGLSIDDLYSAINQFDNGDYTITDSSERIFDKLFKKKNESEIENIRTFLNEKIKNNGSDKVLTKKEVATLMNGVGANVGHINKIPKAVAVILDILPFGEGIGRVVNDINSLYLGGNKDQGRKMSELDDKVYPKLDVER